MNKLFTFVICCAFGSAHAQITMYEQEPNNEPSSVNHVSAPIIILGTMQNNDQDMFAWEVSDIDAGYLWDIELEGIPDKLTKIDVVKLSFTEDGTGITKVDKLFSIKNQDGLTTVKEKGLIFSPATYYLGLSYAGGKSTPKSSLMDDKMLASLGDEFVVENQNIDAIKIKEQNGYQLVIKKGKKLPNLNLKNNSKENPASFRKNQSRGVFFESKERWLTFNISAEDASQVWKIDGTVNAGNSAKLDLLNAQEEKIATTSSVALGAFSLPDLKLTAGDYLIKLTSQVDAMARIEYFSVGEYIEGNEAEPNDDFNTANQFPINNSISAKIGKAKDTDYFKFEITEDKAQNQFDLKLTNHDQSGFKLCLYNNNKDRLQCKESNGDINLSQLTLNPGEYKLSVSKGKINSSYNIDAVDTGVRNSIMEAEPNDDFSEAKFMGQKRLVKGRFNNEESDYFVFEVNEESQMWTLQAIGDSIKYIALYNAAGKRVQSLKFNQGTKRARISLLTLQPGKHIVQLTGENSEYILRAFATGPVDKSFESEPNNSLINSKQIDFDQAKKGLLQNSEDIDFYRFHLSNEQAINLEIQPAQDADITYKLHWENMMLGKKTSKPGEKLSYKGTLPAGDYHITLQAAKSASDDVYQLELKNINLLDCEHDCEPNDNAHQANEINPAINLTGETATHEDNDWFTLPPYASETIVTFQKKTGEISHELTGYINYDNKLKAQINPEKNHMSFVIPANNASYYRIAERTQKYDYQILINNQAIEAPKQYKDVKVTLQNVPKKVQAYSPYAQLIQAQLSIENTGQQDQLVSVEASANDHRWRIDFKDKSSEFNIKSNEKISIPININVPNELLRNQLIRLSFLINNSQGLVSQAWHDIKAEIDMPLIQPRQYWSIDQALLGGINVAATAMGAQRTTEDVKYNGNGNGFGFDQLFDGVAADGLGMQYRGGRKADEDFITIDLAGDEIIHVQGIVLNPLSQGKANEYAKDFDLHLSTDGTDFKSVLTGRIKPVIAEQSFVLPQVIPAKFARLYLLNSYHNIDKPRTSLGEWKVIASPAQAINGPSGYNIADPKLGGNVIWSMPASASASGLNKNLLTEKQENNSIRAKTNEAWQWVVGFHNERAAKIDKIEWQHPLIDSKRSNLQLKQVKILASLNSNVGPWTVVVEKQFENMQSMDEIIFDQPVWARYVKFDVGSIKPSQGAYLPNTIRIFEHPQDKDYQSILAEWGELSVDAIYEKTHPPEIKQNLDDINNHSKTTAIDLTTAHSASGQVQLEQADKKDWYKIKTQDGSNTLKINLSGKQTIETVIEVEDAQGNKLPLITHKKAANNIEYRIPVAANQDYFIQVQEPPRSVMFVWDTSGSTQNFKPLIYNAISSFSNGVVEGRDTVNFLPFGGDVLMKDWYGKPYYLKTILNNYPQKDNSSSAEQYLYKATNALAQRQGSKSIIVITDAITSKYAELWGAFRKTKPRVFSIGIIQNSFGGNPKHQIDLMRSWSRVNNGDFQRVGNVTQVEQAFDRVAVKLRQAADYTISLSSEYIQEPGPGQLIISQAEASQSSAVELILDASGSMLKRLDGKRRIDIAKAVLSYAVTEIIPAGTPLALRVFGDKQANACRTDLAIKLNPLDRNKAKNTLNKIQAMNLAKTPIADSLAQVPNDLKGHAGKKIVILVTDGEETCEGNPEEVINKLIEQGIDIRLNIVGFAINDEDLKAQFNKWSIQGGGKYFDSTNSESLKQSISHALKTPFSVFSLSGELIKEGVVNGESLELPAGLYNIKIYGNDIQSIDNYHLKGDAEQHIELSM